MIDLKISIFDDLIGHVRREDFAIDGIGNGENKTRPDFRGGYFTVRDFRSVLTVFQLGELCIGGIIGGDDQRIVIDGATQNERRGDASFNDFDGGNHFIFLRRRNGG